MVTNHVLLYNTIFNTFHRSTNALKLKQVNSLKQVFPNLFSFVAQITFEWKHCRLVSCRTWLSCLDLILQFQSKFTQGCVAQASEYVTESV